MPYIVRSPRLTRMVPALAATVLAALAASGPAAAATPVPTVCVTPAFSQIFLPWRDTALYTKSPGGDFEGAIAGWTQTAGAQVVGGNEPFYVGELTDRSSLLLPAGASAVSSPMCIDRTYPSFRFFARSLAGGQGDLRVEVLWQESGTRKSMTATLDRKPGSFWTPVRSLRLPSGALSTGQLEPVTFRFTTAARGGTWQVDDLYVDPYYRR